VHLPSDAEVNNRCSMKNTLIRRKISLVVPFDHFHFPLAFLRCFSGLCLFVCWCLLFYLRQDPAIFYANRRRPIEPITSSLLESRGGLESALLRHHYFYYYDHLHFPAPSHTEKQSWISPSSFFSRMWECKCCLGFGLALVGRESSRNRVNNFNPFVQKRGCWAVYKNKLNWNANFMLIERGFYAAIDFMSCFLACLNGAFFGICCGQQILRHLKH